MRQIITSFIITFSVTLIFAQHALSEDKISIDYSMAEKTVDWLEYINTGANDDEVKEYFVNNIAPTGGCKAIIDHWARFMEWDAEKLYEFIMKALGKMPCEEPTRDEDGNLTGFGRRSIYWQEALQNPQALKRDIIALKEANVLSSSAGKTREFLPADAPLQVDFYVVMFGGSNAFAVNNKNGFDLLQMPKLEDGSIDVESVVGIFAHEIHHVGFSKNTNNHMKDVKDEGKIKLLAILAAEGMPTYFIDDVERNLEKFKQSPDPGRRKIAQTWEEYITDRQQLFENAARDIKANLAGDIDNSEIFEKWMGGIKGPAYFVGYHMFKTIDENLGTEAAIPVAEDYRQFLKLYNQAAKKANADGSTCYVFDDSLTEEILHFRGE